MKILQINSVCGIGSTGRIATAIHNILVEQGHDSYIAYGRDLPKNCNTSIRIGTKYNNYTHIATTRIFDKHGFGSMKATRDFIREVEKVNPDVIHLHNIHGYYINVELLFDYLKKADKPVIWTLHDCWPFTGHCAYFDYVDCDKWKTGCFDCQEKHSYPASKFIDNSLGNYSKKKNIFNGVKNLTIVTPSKWLGSLVKESFLSKYPVEVINNGIDLDVFKPIESNLRKRYDLKNKFVILGVASIWDRRKGFEYFIELSNRLENDEVIVLVGLSEKQKKELPKNIIGITKTNNSKELVEMYSAANVFVNPTLEDNFPTTNLEALACGTPVITFSTGGSVESIDESCGYVVDKGNAAELLERIKKIKNKSIFPRQCRIRAEKFYREIDRFNQYIKLYLSKL